jgi:hypothetical protein
MPRSERRRKAQKERRWNCQFTDAEMNYFPGYFSISVSGQKNLFRTAFK